VIRVGYERYGLQSDLEHFEIMQRIEQCPFPIEEVAWVREGPQSKADRVQRLVPDLKSGRMFLPFVVWHEAKVRYWKWQDSALDYDSNEGIRRKGDGKIRARAAALNSWMKLWSSLAACFVKGIIATARLNWI
jgi:hypothetical protein